MEDNQKQATALANKLKRLQRQVETRNSNAETLKSSPLKPQLDLEQKLQMFEEVLS